MTYIKYYNYFLAMQSEGAVEHVPVFERTSGSLCSTSPNVQPSTSQPILTVHQQTQAKLLCSPLHRVMLRSSLQIKSYPQT
jgi:hypothetical protein